MTAADLYGFAPDHAPLPVIAGLAARYLGVADADPAAPSPAISAADGPDVSQTALLSFRPTSNT